MGKIEEYNSFNLINVVILVILITLYLMFVSRVHKRSAVVAVAGLLCLLVLSILCPFFLFLQYKSSYNVTTTRSVHSYCSVPKVSLETANYNGENITNKLEPSVSIYYVSGNNRYVDDNYRLKPLDRPLVNRITYDKTNKVVNVFGVSYTQKDCFSIAGYVECYFSLSICSDDTRCKCSYIYTTLNNNTDHGKRTNIGLSIEQYVSDNCTLYNHDIEFFYKADSVETLDGSAIVSYYISSSNYAYKDTYTCSMTEYATEPIYNSALLTTSVVAAAGLLIPTWEIIIRK